MKFDIDIKLNEDGYGSKWRWKIAPEGSQWFSDGRSGTAHTKNGALKKAKAEAKRLAAIRAANESEAALYVYDTETDELVVR